MTVKKTRCTCCGMESEERDAKGVCVDCQQGNHQIHCGKGASAQAAEPVSAPAPAPAATEPANTAVVPAGPQAVDKKASTPLDSVKSFLERLVPNMAAVLPKHLTPERMIKVALVACSKTPKLLEASSQSMAAAVMQAAELGLEPGGALGHGYLVPFKNKKKDPATGQEKWVTEVQFIPGYRGLIALARNSGEISQIGAWPVFKGEAFSYAVTDQGQKLDHIPKLDGTRKPEDLTHVYAIARLKGEDLPQIEVMTRAEVEAIRARSKSKDFGPWVTDFVEMSRKTVVRRIIKYLPLSAEKQQTLARIVEVDNRDYEDAASLQVLPDDDEGMIEMPKRASEVHVEGAPKNEAAAS